jgi:hypothetical protein
LMTWKGLNAQVGQQLSQSRLADRAPLPAVMKCPHRSTFVAVVVFMQREKEFPYFMSWRESDKS